MRYRDQYDGSELEATLETATYIDPEEDQAQQSGAEDADLNVMLRRFGITGEMPDPPASAPFYGDFTGVTDYQSALAALEDARDAFMTLPGEARARFENDPGQLIAFVSDPANRAEAARLGLLQAPEVVPEPPAVPTPPAGS